MLLHVNIPYYASYIHLLFSNRNSKINAYVNSNMENVTENLKGSQLLKTFCIVHYLCFSIIKEMTVVDIQTKSNY